MPLAALTPLAKVAIAAALAVTVTLAAAEVLPRYKWYCKCGVFLIINSKCSR